MRDEQLTEDLVTDVVLPDEVAQKLLIHTGLVNNLHHEGVRA